MGKQEIKQHKKKFSIIIPAYNIENYIQRAIKSVENQTFRNFEIIVVNDCSTDNTKGKILELSNQYDNIILKNHLKNKRAGGARNTGLKIATGEYILFLDGDDYLSNNDVLDKLNKTIGKDEEDVIYLGFQMEGDRTELVIPREETCTKTYKAAKDLYMNAWSKCWRRKYLEENNITFPEYRFYEDVLFVYNGVMKSNSFKIADYVVHNYSSGRTNSTTTKISFKNIDDTIKNLKAFVKIKEKEGTVEADFIIKKEINLCKERLDKMQRQLFENEIKNKD